MTRTLLLKELRDLRPWGVLAIMLGAFDFLPELLTQLDMRPLAQTVGIFSDEGAAVFWVLAFAIGTGLTTREQDDRTLAFLDGLPVTRSRVFLIKCGVTIALVMLAPLIRFLVVLLEHLLSRGSLDYAVHPLLLLQLLGLQLLVICHGVALGAALGRLRSLTWLTIGGAATVLAYATELYPRAAVLNPLSLTAAPLSSAGLTIDGQALWLQVAIATGAFAIAWHGFLRAGRPRSFFASPRPVVGALISAATVVVIGVGFVLWAGDDLEESVAVKTARDDQPRFAPSPPAQTTTRHYEISYPAHEASRALELARRADDIFERVHALLGATPGAPISVDTSGSGRNTLGTAFFGRIRMQLDDNAVIVLAHETAHVVARRAAGNTAATRWQQTDVLDEGLATWVEYHFAAEAARADGLFVLAALHARRELLGEELFDSQRLGALRDENLKYPAGEALISAVVRLYGAQALPRLLQAFADERVPSDLRGEPLWQATFQLAEMDLGAVIDEFYREVTAYARTNSAAIAALPRVRVRLVTSGDRIGVQPLLEGEMTEDAAQELQLRFKPEPDSAIAQLEAARAVPSIPVWRAAAKISGGKVCVQAGVVRGEQVLYEPWVCLPLDDAVEWSEDG
jgi:hypothetical protein